MTCYLCQRICPTSVWQHEVDGRLEKFCSLMCIGQWKYREEERLKKLCRPEPKYIPNYTTEEYRREVERAFFGWNDLENAIQKAAAEIAARVPAMKEDGVLNNQITIAGIMREFLKKA